MTTRALPTARRPVAERSTIVALALALPACAHAQGEGLFTLLFGALAVVYVVVVLVVLLVVRKRPWQRRTKVRLALALVVGPFVPFVLGALVSDLDERYRLWVQKRETAQAVRYLEQACATQRVVPSAAVTVHGADGLFVSTTPPLNLPDAPALLATGWFDGPRSAMLRRRQYGLAAAWTNQTYAPTLPPGHGFAFVEMKSHDHLAASATHDWWQSRGLARVSSDRRPELLRMLHENHEPMVYAELGDDQQQARYRIELADISTVEDRRHWVARGRMRLVDGRDGRVLAQYVGFSVDLESNAAADDGNAWERTLECPGPERRYSLGSIAWSGVDFFFGQFVHVD